MPSRPHRDLLARDLLGLLDRAVEVSDPVGGDAAWQDRVERDPVPGELLRQSLNAPSRPGRCAFDISSAGIGSRAADDETLTIRPKPRSRIPGTTSLIISIGAIDELAVRRLPLLAGELERIAAGRPAGVRDENLDGPEVARHRVDQAGGGV